MAPLLDQNVKMTLTLLLSFSSHSLTMSDREVRRKDVQRTEELDQSVVSFRNKGGLGYSRLTWRETISWITPGDQGNMVQTQMGLFSEWWLPVFV